METSGDLCTGFWRCVLCAGVSNASCGWKCGEYASNHAPTSERDDLGCLPGTPRLVRIVLGSLVVVLGSAKNDQGCNRKACPGPALACV